MEEIIFKINGDMTIIGKVSSVSLFVRRINAGVCCVVFMNKKAHIIMVC